MAARRAFQAACSINGLTNTGSRLAAVVLATLVVILNVTSAHASQRCYMCGPVSVDWYIKTGVNPCSRFRPIPEYEMDCGPGYNYCAVFYNHQMLLESRACTQRFSENCVAKGDAYYKNMYTVCSCNGTLCNNKTMEFQKVTLIPYVTKATPTTEYTKQSTTQEDNVTTVKHDLVTEDQENVKEETNAKHEEKKESNESDEEMKVNKTKELNTKMERAVPNMTEEHKNDISGHALPLPEALGQEHKKKPALQGAPVDDEEDTSEGSGSRIETDNKSHHHPHHPTTTVITYLDPETETAEPPRNVAASFHSSVVISLVIWTIAARIILA